MPLLVSRRTVVLGAAAALAAPAFGASARFPDHPLRLVVGFVPGGPNDVMARIMAQQLAVELGQPVVVENKAGAGGVIGSDFVAKSPPDGYTLLFASAPFVMAPALQAHLPFDTLRDFAPITKVAESPMVLMVPGTSRFTSATALIEYARSHPGKVNYGSGGVGSTPHLTTELLSTLTGAKFTHIPYKGGGDSIKALMSGEIDMLIDSITSTESALRSGRVKPLAVAAATRSSKLPDVPTFSESGTVKFDMTHWVGILAPAKVPGPVLEQLRQASVKAVHAPAVVKALADRGAQPVGDSAAGFGQFIASELDRWQSVAKSAHITAQ